jgi:hypothetical protein
MMRQRPLILWVFNYMEIWKEVKGYEGIYQISSFGRVKSLSRTIKREDFDIKLKEKILVNFNNSNGYLHVTLNKNGISKNVKIHQLVAIAFLNLKPDGTHKVVVDHIDNNKHNNNLENLQLLNNRQNSSKEQRGFSKYTGVGFAKREMKWRAYISINNKYNHLGYFKTELEAHYAYQNAINKI